MVVVMMVMVMMMVVVEAWDVVNRGWLRTRLEFDALDLAKLSECVFEFMLVDVELVVADVEMLQETRGIG